MSGENCTISIKNYGSYKVHCTAIDYGLTIIATQDQARARRAFYVTKWLDDGFGIDIQFSTEAAFDKFCTWLRNYGRSIIQTNSVVGVVTVSVPSRKFLKSGIPANSGGSSSPIPFETRVGMLAPKMHLDFVGTKDAFNVSEKSKYSHFQNPSKRALILNPQIAYFYPAGTQLSGSQYGNDALYDDQPDLVDIQQQVRAEQGGNI